MGIFRNYSYKKLASMYKQGDVRGLTRVLHDGKGKDIPEALGFIVQILDETERMTPSEKEDIQQKIQDLSMDPLQEVSGKEIFEGLFGNKTDRCQRVSTSIVLSSGISKLLTLVNDRSPAVTESSVAILTFVIEYGGDEAFIKANGVSKLFQFSREENDKINRNIIQIMNYVVENGWYNEFLISGGIDYIKSIINLHNELSCEAIKIIRMLIVNGRSEVVIKEIGVEKILGLLKNPDEMIRLEAIITIIEMIYIGLGKDLEKYNSIPLIINGLNDPNECMKSLSALALGSLASRGGQESLIQSSVPSILLWHIANYHGSAFLSSALLSLGIIVDMGGSEFVVQNGGVQILNNLLYLNNPEIISSVTEVLSTLELTKCEQEIVSNSSNHSKRINEQKNLIYIAALQRNVDSGLQQISENQKRIDSDLQRIMGNN